MMNVIKAALFVSLAGFGLTEVDSRAPASAGIEQLAYLAGDWTAEFETFADTWGREGAGTMPGVVRGWFGPLDAWFEMEAEMVLPGSGPYAVKVLVYEDGRSGTLRSFVVNSFDAGATYEGSMTDEGELVFTARIGDKIQQVRYERHGDRVRYVAEESADDGATFQPHTQAWWVRE